MFQYLCIWNFQQLLNILPLLIPRFISIWLYAFIITEKFRLSQKKQLYGTSPHFIHNAPHMVYIDFINGHLPPSRFTSHFYLITFQSNLMIIQLNIYAYIIQKSLVYYSSISYTLKSSPLALKLIFDEFLWLMGKLYHKRKKKNNLHKFWM